MDKPFQLEIKLATAADSARRGAASIAGHELVSTREL
jgi:hypothetical protein